MIIKTFTAKTEAEALEKAREELGEGAMIANIKKYKGRGIFSKSKVEVTAIKDGVKKDYKKEAEVSEKNIFLEKMGNVKKLMKVENKAQKKENNEKTDENEKIIRELQEKITKSNRLVSILTKDVVELTGKSEPKNKFKNEHKQAEEIYQKLIEENVLEPVARALVESIEEENLDIKMCYKKVYSDIVNIIGEVEAITVKNNTEGKGVMFLGPTGVGKTTTLAKLASKFSIEDNLQIGFITSDTYRIAAVDQLKIYGDILDADVLVSYEKDDLIESYKKLKNNVDIVLIDTAGRSHKNLKEVKELEEIASSIKGLDKYLVLSLTTKTEDLISIIQTYAEYFDFKIILTKEDETLSFGDILNMSYMTQKKMSYITNGQNVPEDIKLLDAKKIAESILGLGDNNVCRPSR